MVRVAIVNQARGLLSRVQDDTLADISAVNCRQPGKSHDAILGSG